MPIIDPGDVDVEWPDPDDRSSFADDVAPTTGVRQNVPDDGEWTIPAEADEREPDPQRSA